MGGGFFTKPLRVKVKTGWRAMFCAGVTMLPTALIHQPIVICEKSKWDISPGYTTPYKSQNRVVGVIGLEPMTDGI